MAYTQALDTAIQLAAHLHRNQTRNDNNHTPYISHLMSVAMLLQSVQADEDTIVAGLMHDSLEDVPGYTYEKLVTDTNVRVAEIVRHVTEPLDANKKTDEQLPWLSRKERYLEVLRSGDRESAMVSAADKIHNTESFIRDVTREGELFSRRFGSSVRNRVWFHTQVLGIVSEKLGQDHPLIIRLEICTRTFEELMIHLEQV